ncbi:MAG: ATP-binding protein, partial [Bacteroidaceae bacterium]|nr:ATP-binding protein [Bacteroidaceae bacterium]
MTKEELITHLQDIEWEDFEAKEAKDKVPSNVWESVSAFSNTSGGWIVFGVKQVGKKFEVQGVSDGERIESDFLNTLRGGQKMSCKIFPEAQKYSIDGKTVLAFHIPSSPSKPAYFGGTVANTFIRSGSGDRRATEVEINAMFRDQMFGVKSEQ